MQNVQGEAIQFCLCSCSRCGRGESIIRDRFFFLNMRKQLIRRSLFSSHLAIHQYNRKNTKCSQDFARLPVWKRVRTHRVRSYHKCIETFNAICNSSQYSCSFSGNNTIININITTSIHFTSFGK